MGGPGGRRPSNRAFPEGPAGPPGRRMCLWMAFTISMNSSLLSLPSLSLSNFANISSGFGRCAPPAPAGPPLPALPPPRAPRISRIFSRALARSSSSNLPSLLASNSLSIRSRISARRSSPFLVSLSGDWAIAERASTLAAVNAKQETRYRISVPFENYGNR
jgi:hypothetical protein